ncbi:Ig-like domain-containing protein [Rheinheimera pleomorphica]|uniref:Ig-like domain-containing protein n=1 Tax=Rheinheimera pleomorphica TaxID=2703963 RepID=UPI0014239A2F|nr:Ig-like domain-containing protein [Rheinheimera pleomorphica]
MKNLILTGLSSVLLPFAGYAAQFTGSYQRSYLSAAAPAANDVPSNGISQKPLPALATNVTTDTANMQLELQQAMPVEELFVVDAALNAADKAILRRAIKPGVAWVELDHSSSGLTQLQQALAAYSNLATVRIFSHATAGALSLGGSHIDANSLMQHPDTFKALNNALRTGGDLLFYGCELAKGVDGEQFIDLIKNNTHIDVAASTNLTGNAALGGDWELEIQTGVIDATPLANSVALKDFTSILPFTGVIDFSHYKAGSGAYNDGGSYLADAQFYESGAKNYLLTVNGADRGTYRWPGGYVVNAQDYETSITLEFTNNETFTPTSISLYNFSGSARTFSLTTSKGGSVSSGSVGHLEWKSNIDISSLPDDVTSVTITGSGPFWLGIDDLAVSNLQTPDATPPVVQSISLSGAPAAAATSVTYTVTFNETANNISSDDFQVTTVSGTAAGTVSAVSASSGSSVDVTVTGITGTGAIRLDLKANTNITDNAGNGNNTNGYVAAFTSGATHTADRDAPAAPSTPDLAAGSDSGSSSTDNITNDNTPTFTGTAEANSTVSVISSVSGTLGTTSADGAGNWSFTAGAMASGAHTITATATDAATNTSVASPGLAITIDTTTPAAPSAPDLSAASDSGSSNTDNLTNNTTPSFTGTAEANSTVSVMSSLSGTLGSTTADGSGNWSFTAGAMSAGTHTITATATDVSGNTSGASSGLAITIDTTVPSVASVSVPANATYSSGQNLDFTVNSSENVTLDTGGGTPQLALTIGATTRQATYLSGSGSSALLFRYTVQAGDNDSDGIAVAGSIDTNGGTVRDAAGNALNTTLNAVGATANVLVDAVAPTVSSVSVPANATYSSGQNLDFTVNSSENITVDTGGGTPQLALTIGATTRQATYLSGSGSSALVFRYTVQAGDSDSDGIAVAASIDTNGGTMRDAAGNALNTTLNAVGATTSVLVDAVAPTLQTLNPADGASNVAVDANFVMTFSENIALGAGDIVIYDSADTPVVSIDVAANGGQLSITNNELTINPTADLNENTSYYIQLANGAITDLAGTPYAGLADNTSWNFTVADITPPTVTAITVNGAPLTTAESMQFTVTFDEVPANVTVADFSLTLSGATVSANIASVSAVNANSVTVTIDQISGTGTLRLDVIANSGITDALGNGNGTNGFVPAFSSGELHAVDREAPAVPANLTLDAASDSGVPADAITNDNTPTINGTADANVTVALSSSLDGAIGSTTADANGDWSLTPAMALSDGSHNLTAVASDAANNTSAASAALTLAIDTVAPSASLVFADSSLVAGDTSLVTITFNEAVTGFSNDDLTVANGSLSPVSSSDGGISWSTTFTPAADTTAATNVISLNMTAVADIAGNAGSGSTNSANYSIDTLRPTASLVMADTELLAGETSQLTITFSEAVSGLTNDDLSVLFGSLDAVTSADGGITWTATYTPDADTYELNNAITLDTSGVTDAAGNTGSGNSSSNEFTVRTQSLTLLVTSDLDINDDETTAVTLVDDEADGNGLSLREALFWARAGDTITFDLDNSTAGKQGGNISLNGTELAINHSDLTINGDLDTDQRPDITISANHSSRVLAIGSGLSNIDINGLTLTQGTVSGGGAGIAIGNNASVTLRNAVISDNNETALGGGGIYGASVNLTLVNTSVVGNSSTSFGGGLRIVGNASNLTLINSTVSGNTTSGASAHGGGIQFDSTETLTLVNTTISGNAALGAGAVGGGLRVTSGTANLYNSTLVGNAAASAGGGLSANGTDTVINSVIAGNTAGADAAAGAAGSALASGGVPDDVNGTIEIASHSFFGSNAIITTDTSSLNNQGTSELLLTDLADNGGVVLTHQPLAGSALSDAGSTAALPADSYDIDADSNIAEALPLDAVGAARIAGAAVDIGAVEGNRAPVLSDLAGGNTFIEAGSPVVIDNDITVTDDELDILNGGNGNYSGAFVTIMRSGGANSTDSFSFADGSGMSLVAGEVLKNGLAIASFDTSSAGQLLLTFTDANGELPERSDVNAIMQQITYTNSSNDPDTSVVLDWTFTDEAGAPVTETASVSISLKNDAPVLTATGGAVTFTENGAAVDLFNNLSIDLIEAAQSVIGLQLTVTGVNNGSAEILTIDGSDIALTQANSLTTASNALQASVVLTGSTATVSLSHATGISSALTEAILDAITYRNSSQDPNPLSRVVTLNSLQDDGGTANDGVDSSMPAIVTTVTISAVNNAPTISGIAATLVNQNTLYSFTPSAADVDSNSLTFSIANQPAWASFNSATGTLRGVPAQADVGVNSNIVISVSDGELSSSLPAFSLTVIDVNDAPTISGSPATTVAQDALYSFTPTASDIDTGDNLTFSISNKPGWASFNSANGALTGTPGNSDVGTTAGIVISVSDGSLSATLPAFSLTVTNVNDAPTISGSPATTVAQDAPYSFTPTASDIDTGDNLTFSISNKPGWASFNSASGALTGTPGNSDVGSTAGIVISVSDGSLTAALPAFSLTVTNVNDAPSISGSPATTVSQDAQYSFTPTASDPDDDTLSFSISNKPSWASFDTATGALTGTPAKTDVGTTTGIVISVSDGEFTASLDAFNLEVVNVNAAPLAVDDNFTLLVSDNHSYLLDVLLNDTDPDEDSLTITTAKASIGLVSIQANKLLFTAPDNFSGTASFSYRISDGELSDMARVTLQIAGSNQNAPVITAPSDLTVDATGLFTKVDVGVATAVDSTGNRLAVSLVNGIPLFSTGRHELYWRATDASGQSSTVTQLLQINPLVSLSKPQTVLNNSTVSFDVILNGPPPAYPVEVGYVVTGSASTLTEHDLAAGSVQIDSGLRASISFNVFADLTTEAEKQIVITLDDNLNLGVNASTTITVTEANLAPVIQLDAQQQGENRLTLSKTAGVVTVSAQVFDANPADTVSLQWQADAALLNTSADTSQFVFDPADLSSGVYRIAVTATDDAPQPLSRTAEVYLLVQDTLPVLDDSDSNNNLIPDNVEGLGDSNGNGIADYLDPGFDCNVIPEQLAAVTQFVAEGEPGICLRKGATAVLSNTGGIQLTSADLQWLEPDMQASNIGGTFDFILRNLPATGASYALALPQRQPVPANAVYRKFTPANGWNNFVQNEQNRLFSAPGEPGFCPPPGSSNWQPGLTAGHWCVQLTIEDGGPNDADGLANGAIVDPGGVAVILNNNQLPVAADDSYAVQWNQSHTLDVLQNDTDADADTLSINQATAAFGNVSISDDGLTLLYTPSQDFVGEDSLSYAITDGNNGSASATVTVTVYYNRAPVVTNATASTDDRTSLELDVLANASDPDGDTLVISSATAQHGSVSVTAAQTLSYTPQPGFDGTDTVSFTLSDQRGGSVNGTVNITVTAYEVITVVNKSSGGALYGWPLLLLAALAVMRRRQNVLKPLLILAALFSFNSQANWSVEALFGNSTTRQSTAEVSRLLPADAELLQYDNSGNSWALGLSYYFTPRLAVQAHYVDLGDASVSIRGDSLTPAQFHQTVSDIGPMLAEGVRSGLSYHLWQYAGWSATVQAGVFAWDSETHSRAGNNLIQNKASDTDLYWALGARYALDQHLALQAMFNRYHLQGNKADNVMLGVSYHF